MATLASDILWVVYKATFSLLRKIAISKIDDGDVGLGKIKDNLTSAIEKLEKGIDAIRKKELRASVTEQQIALSHVTHNQLYEASHHFRLSYQHAVMAFGVVSDIEDKVLATRLQILAILHLGYFFYRGPTGEVCNNIAVQEQCHLAFKRLCDETPIITAIRDEFDGRSVFSMLANVSGKSAILDRQKILCEISSLNLYFHSIFSQKFPVKKQNGEIVCLSTAKYFKFSYSVYSVTCFVLLDDVLIRGKSNTTTGRYITVWQLNTLSDVIITRCTPATGHRSNVSCLCVNENKLYSASHGVILIHDVSSGQSEPIGRLILPTTDHCDVKQIVCTKDLLFVLLYNGHVLLFNIDSLQQITSSPGLETIQRNPVNSLAIWSNTICAGGSLLSDSMIYAISSTMQSSDIIAVAHPIGLSAILVQDGLLYVAQKCSAVDVYELCGNETRQKEKFETNLVSLCVLNSRENEKVYVDLSSAVCNCLYMHSHILFCGSGSAPFVVVMWDIRTGELIDILPFSNAVRQMAVFNGKLYCLMDGLRDMVVQLL